MVRICCICKLEPQTIDDVSFHSIPKREELRAKWFINIGREVNKHSAVCSRHFEKKYFIYKVYGNDVRRLLHPTAVPTILDTKFNNEIVNDENVKCQDVKTENVENANIANENVELDNSVNYTAVLSEFDDTSVSFTDAAGNNKVTEQNERIVIKSSNTQILEDSAAIDSNIDCCKQTEVNFSDDSQCSIDNSEGIENNRKMNSEKLTSKRKYNMFPNSSKPKRFCNARYIGDLRREDFTSNLSWNIVQNFVVDSRKKQKVLNQKIKRLNQKTEYLQALLEHLKQKVQGKK
ncbi:uncharacterized protein LOC105661743 isoform X2 [Megachile rotundata]|uniref:uncharacterized protein LOC105661743 isoform X2 n=1 Tax=Megachile rotundata TaxID=143995 RepID=UPI000614D175|nr:PREDICTED: uncharacterized protein LOC105661743 [Megachile rotundata]